jgi:hypothetical protein
MRAGRRHLGVASEVETIHPATVAGGDSAAVAVNERTNYAIEKHSHRRTRAANSAVAGAVAGDEGKPDGRRGDHDGRPASGHRRTVDPELGLGKNVALKLTPWDSAEKKYGSYYRIEPASDDALLLDAYWGEVYN